MSRLPKYAPVGQRELFDRADLPTHTPRIEHYAAVERRRVQSEPKPALWEGMASWVRQLAAFPPGWQRSAAQDERFAKTARLLDVEKVRICRHPESLAMVEEWLLDFRNNEIIQVFTRAQIGTLIVEVRNRRAVLALGRDQPKVKGPRLDPTRLPDDALDRLIQQHLDLDVVEQLRAERRRRQETR